MHLTWLLIILLYFIKFIKTINENIDILWTLMNSTKNLNYEIQYSNFLVNTILYFITNKNNSFKCCSNSEKSYFL